MSGDAADVDGQVADDGLRRRRDAAAVAVPQRRRRLALVLPLPRPAALQTPSTGTDIKKQQKNDDARSLRAISVTAFLFDGLRKRETEGRGAFVTAATQSPAASTLVKQFHRRKKSL